MPIWATTCAPCHVSVWMSIWRANGPPVVPVHRPTAQSGRNQGLVSVGPIHRHVLEQRQAAPARAITIEEVKQYDAVVGHEHRLGRSALATQRELEDIALLHGLIAVTHVPALRITFVTVLKAG